ncbi:hypothetical protein DSM104329_00131 [Capillimicrobium parvum]|uniref:Uncharacterized protein n=2 Tax=Capillimicrobium parvum TaxID=2884022 RepID=A0A9E7BWB6_9ACTN|nr:hypothetical protein DSM104329_00131 [Capillimicrobium parvum]
MAALVAADTLGERGERVRLLLPGRGVGGGFAALRRDGRTLELGVRLLELSYEGDAALVPPLEDYRPGGHRPYVRRIRAWMQELVGRRLVEAGRPAMVLEGAERADDILFTVDLAPLRGMLGPRVADTMAAEVQARLAAGSGDAGVLAADRAAQLDGLTLEQASLANHGEGFHRRVIAPLCDKVVDGGAGAVLASLRRKAWAPLFHPRTLLQALRGEPLGFRGARPFHTVAGDGCGAIVDALLTRIRARDGVTVEVAGALTSVRPAGAATALGFANGREVVTERPVLGAGAAELFAAAGIGYHPARARTVLAWLEVAERDTIDLPHLVHVLDPVNPVLRVSTSGSAPPGRRVLCVELRHDLDAAAIVAAATGGLRDAGLVVKDAALEPITGAARPTFPAPSPANRRAFAAARAAFADRELDVAVVGGALGPAADSLNEQIVQGLLVGAAAA